jgi:DNA polymerase II small subunit
LVQETEELEKAVKTLISTGYQLNKDAFDFLKMLSSTEDLEVIIRGILARAERLDGNSFFIDKTFIENLLPKIQAREEVSEDGQETQRTIAHEAISESTKPTGGGKSYYSFSEDVQSELRIIDDAGNNLSSNGTINDYLEYFHDRFTKMEKLLRQRIDVKSAASIVDVLKSQPNTRRKIIGMISEKREAKQKIILRIEDPHANMTALVSQNASEDLRRKARMLLLDQVVCLDVVKTRGSLLIVEDIIFPDVPQRTPRRARIPVFAVFTSDMHVGSTQFQKEAFNRFILWLNGKYGSNEMREIASHVKYVIVAGDIVDGVGVYPNQIKELAIRDIYKQYKLAAKYFGQIPDYIDVVVTPGNHDATRKALPQPAISKKMLNTLEYSRTIHSLGSPCIVSLHGVEVLIYHGRSIDDINSTISGMNNDHPERAMKLLMQGRHIAPVYGGKTLLSPENRDSLVVEKVPDIFHAGHIHAVGYTTYKGILLINSGGWQGQTDYMRKLGFTPTPNIVPVVNLQSLELTTLSFN